MVRWLILADQPDGVVIDRAECRPRAAERAGQGSGSLIPPLHQLAGANKRDARRDGELAHREGEHDEAFAHLRRAIELDDTLPYDEPWGWMQPTRHAYGALLLEQGEVELAEAVYAADLGLDATLGRACQHPGNVWSLHGYHECLTRLGKNDAARVIAQQLKLAAARADVPIRASCACRMSVA